MKPRGQLSALLLVVSGVVAFRPSPYLNDLLVFNNGSKVATVEQWEVRRHELKELLQDTLFGRVPTETPSITSSSVVNSTTSPGGVTSTFVQLNYSCGVTTYIEILRPVPRQLSTMRLPLFMTQWNHREWAALGASRGYLAVSYMGADIADSAPAFQRAYPNATMALIMARAWVASRVLDYLVTLDYVDPSQISISGHSRNGKQSLIAAAFDERITAVVGSSPGAPISSPYHFTSSNFYGEGPRTGGVAGLWWLKSILQYDEHPERLPVDGHAVLALIAPRHAVIATARNDFDSDMRFAGEMACREATKPYALYGRVERLRIMGRDGDHHGFNDYQSYFDWFDTAFSRRVPRMSSPSLCTGSCWVVAPEDLSTYTTAAGFSWTVWKAAYGTATPPAPPTTAPLRDRVAWVLQTDTSPYAFCGGNVGEELKAADYIPGMMRHSPLEYPGVAMATASFGESVDVNLYWPSNVSKSHPQRVLIWLHPYSYNTGYSPSYLQTNVPQYMASKGYVVMAYDMIGFGLRSVKGGNVFYDRTGGTGSLFGRMVHEVSMAVDFLVCRSNPQATCGAQFHFRAGEFDHFPMIDAGRIAVAGYSLGGAVALHAAALDDRVYAVASFAGWTPMRSDTADRPTGGLARLYDLHGILPRLGFFAGSETSVPYDYDELILSIAPRHAYVYTPQNDRDATYPDVLRTVQALQTKYKNLTHDAPDANSKFETAEAEALAKWYGSLE